MHLCLAPLTSSSVTRRFSSAVPSSESACKGEGSPNSAVALAAGEVVLATETVDLNLADDARLKHRERRFAVPLRVKQA